MVEYSNKMSKLPIKIYIAQETNSKWNICSKRHAEELARQYAEVVSSFGTEGKQFCTNNCGLCICANNPTGGILVTGINPSGDMAANFAFSFKNALHKSKGFWHDKAKELIDMRYELIDELKLSYLDLFPFHNSNQWKFIDSLKRMSRSLDFQRCILEVTQNEIENVIKPKLIIHANASSAYYWGLNRNAMWMGYKMEKLNDIPNSLQKLQGRLYLITGFRDDMARERINSKLKDTNLKGTIFLRHGLYNRPN